MVVFCSFREDIHISNIRTVKPRNAFPERAVIIFNSLQQTKWICVCSVYRIRSVGRRVHYSFVPIMGKGEKLVYYNTSHTFIVYIATRTFLRHTWYISMCVCTMRNVWLFVCQGIYSECECWEFITLYN